VAVKPAPVVPDATVAPVLAASPRLAAYLAVGAGALVASLLTGRAALAAFGAPLLAIAAGAVWLARPPLLPLRAARLGPAQAMDGDDLQVAVDLDVATGPALSGRVDVSLGMAGPVAPKGGHGGTAAWTVVPGDDPEVRADLATTGWGRVTMGGATVRAYGPLDLVHWTWTVPLGPTTRVLPRPEALGALLDPPPRAAAGRHPSRARGSGLDFAELRPLAPGDRVSDVNWRASARRGPPGPGLLVNVRHPERSGDVVLLLDTAADVTADGTERAPWLPRAAQAAWAVAQAHLASHDRVGLVTFGGYTSWISRGSGRRAAYALLDKLLAARPASTAARSLAWLPVRLLPADAAIVAVTPLHAPQVGEALVDLRRRGRRVAALVVDAADLLPDAPSLDPARRLWSVELTRRTELLGRAGIITTTWAAGTPLAQAVSLLARVSTPLKQPVTAVRR
jgi:uncharacterized protein (DUF58 family)